MERRLFIRPGFQEVLKPSRWLALLALAAFMLFSAGCLGTEANGVTEDSGGTGTDGSSNPEFRGAETANGESIDTIKVEWVLPTFAQDIGSLNVYEVGDGDVYTLLAVLGSGESSYYHTGLTAGSTHRYIVRGLENTTGHEDDNNRIVQATTQSTDGNPLQIAPTNLALAYGQTFFFSASGGDQPYTFSLVSGPGAVIDDSTGEFVALFNSGLAVVKVTDQAGTVSYGAVSVSPGFQLHPENMQLLAHRHLQIEVAGATAPIAYELIEGDSIATLSSDGYLESNGGLGLITVRVTDASGLVKDALIQVVTEMNPQSSHLFSMSITSNCYAQKLGNKLKCWGNASGGAAPSTQGSNIGDQPGEMGDSLPNSEVGDGVLVEVKAGNHFACVLFSTKKLKCFGHGSYGRLLHGTTSNLGDEPGELGSTLPFLDFGPNMEVEQFDLGYSHACAILTNTVTTNKELRCWGGGHYGQLGHESVGGSSLGDTNSEIGNGLPAVNLGIGRTPKKVATGAWHTCVILDNDSLKCFGYNPHGQLGLGHTTNVGLVAGDMANLDPVGIGSVREVSASAFHTCAITTGDQLKCWGHNAYGQLGQENTTPIGDTSPLTPSVPADIALGGVLDADSRVSAGEYSTCVTLSDDKMKCFGLGSRISSLSGNIGDAASEMGLNLNTVEFGSFAAVDETVKAMTSSRYGNFSCVLLNSDQIKCWGYGTSGELGSGDMALWGDSASEKNDGLPYVDLGTGRTVKSVAAGYAHACAVLDNDKVKCWGLEANGSLGHGGNIKGDTPAEMASLEDVRLGDNLLIKDIAGGDNSTCVLFFDGTMKCFGSGGHGRLANGSTATIGDNPGEVTDSLPFSVLSENTTIDSVSLGYLNGCAIMSNQQLKCWGYGYHGEVGNEAASNYGDSPSEVGTDANRPYVDLGTTDTVTQVEVGVHFVCALTTDSEVKCWGRNHYGQLGIGNTENIGNDVGEMGANLMAVDLGVNDATPVQISVGHSHACTVFDNGKVKCWGYNGYGQLGIGDNLARGDSSGEMGTNLPYAMLGDDFYAIKVFAADYTTCALSRNQRVKCWGDAGTGELGRGSTSSRGTAATHLGNDLEYLNFGAYRHVVDIHSNARSSYFCATLDNNDNKCWGRNTSAQLGIGDAENRGDGPGEMGDPLPANLVVY